MSQQTNTARRGPEAAGINFDQSNDKLSRFLHELLTVPNAFTAYRMSQTAWAYKAMRNDAGANWGKLALDISTDLEGNLARFSRIPIVGRYLATVGFRSSKYGRIFDPIADYAYGAAATKGLHDGGILPGHLTKAMLAQKAYKGALTTAATAKGVDLHVSNTGAAGEAATVGCLIGYARSEAESAPGKRFSWRATAYALGVCGLSLSSAASLGYTQDAGFITLPESINEALDTMNRACGKILPGRQAITHAEYLKTIGQEPAINIGPTDQTQQRLGDKLGEAILERLV